MWFCTCECRCPLRLEETGPLEQPDRVARTWIRVLERSRAHISPATFYFCSCLSWTLALLSLLTSICAFFSLWVQSHYALHTCISPEGLVLSVELDSEAGSWLTSFGIGILSLRSDLLPPESPSWPDCSFQTSQPHFSLVPVDYLGGLLIICFSCVSFYVNVMTHTCVAVCCLSLPCVIGLGMPSSLLWCTPSVVFAGLSGFNGRLWVETPVLLPGPPSQNPHPVAYLDGLSGCPRIFSGT